ncbi:MAG: hypothetical protein ACLUNO_08190 [Oscillospiraceae bacterium]
MLTSGSIMVLVTAVVGKFFGNPTIEQISPHDFHRCVLGHHPHPAVPARHACPA